MKFIVAFVCAYNALLILAPNVFTATAVLASVTNPMHYLNVGAYFSILIFFLWTIIALYRLKKWAYYFHLIFTALQVCTLEIGERSYAFSWSLINIGLTFAPRNGSFTLVIDVLPLIVLFLLLTRYRAVVTTNNNRK